MNLSTKITNSEIIARQTGPDILVVLVIFVEASPDTENNKIVI